MTTENLKPEQKNEIATTRDGRDITRGYVDGLPLLPSTDRLLSLKGGGDLRIYEEVLRDDQVKACLEQRFSAVIARPWEVRPGGKSRQDKKAAEFVQEQIARLPWDDITRKMLYGVFYGYAVAEVIWGTENSQIVIKAIKVRNRKRFGFDPEYRLKLRTSSNPMGELLPDRKFWTFSCGTDHDDEPYGLGLAHWLYWPVFFKRNGVKFWMTFLEKFGTPTLWGTYPSGTPETEQNKLLDSMLAAKQDSAIAVPEGMKIALLEATRGGTVDYTSLYDRMDSAIARVVLGQTASTQGTPGRLGNDELQSDVRLDIVKADADLVSMSFAASVAKWLTEYNFGDNVAVPEVWRVIEEPEDLESRSKRDEALYRMGYKPTRKYVQDTYGGEWVEITPPSDTAGDDTLPGGGQPAEFAEGGDELEQFADDLSGGWQAVTDPVIAPVLALAQEVSSFAEFQERLPEVVKDMDINVLAERLAQGQFAARVWGRVNGDDQA